MTQSKTINVEPRDQLGSRASQKIRKEGFVPGTVYGHQVEAKTITIKNTDVEDIIHNREKVVDLVCGGKTETTVVKEVQWNTFSTFVQHIDFLRVDPDERLEMEVVIETHGVAPGVVAGGSLEFAHRSLKIECSVVSIPHAVEARIGGLEIGDALHISDLVLPDGVRSLEDGGIVVAQVNKAAVEEDDDTDDE